MALNQSINNIGNRHHATYMSNMMFANDINGNFKILSKVQEAIYKLYNAINKNYFLKREIGDLLNNKYEMKLISNDFYILNEKQLLELVIQQAYLYYFQIDKENSYDFSSFYEEALQYRIISNFMQSELKCILIKINDDIEIIIEDTNNLNFLLLNYNKVNQGNSMYAEIVNLLKENLRNMIIRDNKFDEDYFYNTKKLNNVIKNSLLWRI